MTLVKPKTTSGNRGSALLAALCFCAVLGIALASYMAVCYQALQTSSRNNNGTHSLELGEIGMEEALWTLNQKSPSAWGSNGWTLNNSVTPKVATKVIDNFSFGNGVTGTVSIKILNYDGTDAAANDVRTIQTTGSTTLTDGSVVTRRLEASAQSTALFVNAIAAVNDASLPNNSSSGTGIRLVSGATVDSFDSNNLAGGSNYSAVVSSSGSMTLVGTTIRGYVAAALSNLGSLQISYDSHARVTGPSTAASMQIDPTRLSSSPYQPQFDIKPPETPPGYPGGAGTITLGTPGTTSYYGATDVIITGPNKLQIEGSVVLVVSGDFTISNGSESEIGKITVMDNSSLQVVLTGVNKKLSIAGGGIENKTNATKNVAIFARNSLQASITPTISTMQEFQGVIYAPTSDLTIASSLTYKGSIVGKNILSYSPARFSYDLDLRRQTTIFSVIDTPFTVSSWKEIAP